MTLPPKTPSDSPASADQVADSLVREALRRVVFLHSGEETPQDWADFLDWKATSADHARAAGRAEEIWEGVAPALKGGQKFRSNKTVPVLLALAVALASVALVVGVFGPPAASFFADYSTATGEIRTVFLRDGSEVDLDSGTSFDIAANERTVTLYTGQIHVAVKPDPQHPFTVVTEGGSIRALGTAFDVRRDGDRTTVVVTEHAVRVTCFHKGQLESVELAVGDMVSFGPTGLGAARKVDVAALTAWRRGELIFNGRPLGDVVAEMDRYQRGKIIVLDDEIDRLPVTGNFETSDSVSFLKSIELALPVRVTELPGLTLIRRDPSRLLPSR
jgi:transmembrane sensor